MTDQQAQALEAELYDVLTPIITPLDHPDHMGDPARTVAKHILCAVQLHSQEDTPFKLATRLRMYIECPDEPIQKIADVISKHLSMMESK